MAILSKAVNNALVWYESNAPQRWVDAVGQNVLKYITHWESAGTADADQIDGWTSTLVEAGAGESTVALTTTAGGHLLITTDANENDGVNMQLDGEAFQLNGTVPLYFGIKFQVNDATQTDFFVGLAITDTTILGGTTDQIGFRKADGSTSVSFITEKDSTESSATVDTIADATDVTYEFYYDGTSCYVYVDNVLTTTITVASDTNFPNDEVLTPSIHYLTGEAVANTMSIDWLRVIQCR